MDKTKLLIGTAVVASLLLSLVAVFQPSPVQQVIKETVREIKEQLGAIPGDSTQGSRWCIGGLCTEVAAGVCSDATTTIFSILNPFSATSTAELVRLSGKNGTSTAIDLLVGTSTVMSIVHGTSSTPVDITPSLLAVAQVGTSTGFHFAGGVIFGPNKATSTAGSAYNSAFWGDIFYDGQAAGQANTFNATTSVLATRKILVGPSERVVGLATSSFLFASGLTDPAGNTGITSAVNQFSCDYAIRFER